MEVTERTNGTTTMPTELTPELPVMARSTSYAADKSKILVRLRRLEGQVRGVQRMVEEDQYCIDVLTQLSAIIAGSRGVGMLVLDDHIRGCILGTCGHDHQNDPEAMLNELSEAIERFTRSAS